VSLCVFMCMYSVPLYTLCMNVFTVCVGTCECVNEISVACIEKCYSLSNLKSYFLPGLTSSTNSF
jgi:hypothetical protein